MTTSPPSCSALLVTARNDNNNTAEGQSSAPATSDIKGDNDNNNYNTTTETSPPVTPTRRSRRRARTRHKQQNMNQQHPPHQPQQQAEAITPTSAWCTNESQALEEALAAVTTSLNAEKDDRLRRQAVEHLERLLAKWTPSETSSTSAPPSNPWNRARPTLVTFGSYRLGVHRADSSDLDVLALCPPEFSRSDFFGSSWVDDLLRRDKLISEVHPIPQAYTPVIKFVFHNTIQVDMLFARLADGKKLREFQQRRVSPTLIANAALGKETATTAALPRRNEYSIDDFDLQDQDEAGVRSLNGARVSQMLLEMVPDLSKFRLVLRAVKEWAIAKGIYSNVLGFLGGVNFAILVAWVCQEYPAASAPELLKSFYRTFCNWSWPDPVVLLPIQSHPPEGAPFVPAWDPQLYPRDRLHLMPIITPAYPSMNSSYNMGIPQLRRIREEMARACRAFAASSLVQPPPTIRKGANGGSIKKNNNTNVFSELLKPSNFFSMHKHYLQITIRAANEQEYLEWFRLVESRLRLLIANMETPETKVWPYSRHFELQYGADGSALGTMGRSQKNCMHESVFFIAIRFQQGVDHQCLGPLTSDFLHKINTWSGRKRGMDLSLAHQLREQLPDFVRPSAEEIALADRQLQQEVKAHNSRNQRYNRRQKKKEIAFHNNTHHKQHHRHGYHRQQSAKNLPSGMVKVEGREDGINILPSSSSSSLLSCDRAETEETQSMGSDEASFAESNSSCSAGSGNKSPMKRICVTYSRALAERGLVDHSNRSPPFVSATTS